MDEMEELPVLILLLFRHNKVRTSQFECVSYPVVDHSVYPRNLSKPQMSEDRTEPPPTFPHEIYHPYVLTVFSTY